MSKKKVKGEMEVMVYDYGKKIFESKGKKGKVIADFENFKMKKGL